MVNRQIQKDFIRAPMGWLGNHRQLNPPSYLFSTGTICNPYGLFNFNFDIRELVTVLSSFYNTNVNIRFYEQLNNADIEYVIYDSGLTTSNSFWAHTRFESTNYLSNFPYENLFPVPVMAHIFRVELNIESCVPDDSFVDHVGNIQLYFNMYKRN